MNNPNKKDNILGIVGSLIFHVVIILILFFTKIYSPSEEKLDEGGGILVAYGEPTFETVNEETPKYTPPTVSPSTEEIIQDSDEATIAAEEEKKREEEERKAKEEEEKKRKEKEEQEAIIKETSSTVSNAFAALNSQSSSESKGSPNGNSNEGALSGNTGYGSFELGSGRGLANGESLPHPQYDNSNDEGKLVVDIIVNPKGDVVDASINSSESSASIRTNYDLRNSAINAAKKAKFEAIKNSNNQKGTITYFFKISQ